MNEWADSEAGDPAVRRVGLVHAALNVAASACSAPRSRRAAAAPAAAAGCSRSPAPGCSALSGHLGGHLSYAEGVGVDQTAFEEPPEDWSAALREDELAEGESRFAEVDGVGVLVARHEGAVYALSNRCAHRGGPLDEGEIADGCVTCPLHGSVFRLDRRRRGAGPGGLPAAALGGPGARRRDRGPPAGVDSGGGDPPRRPAGAAAPARAPRAADRRGRRAVHGRARAGGAAARRQAAPRRPRARAARGDRAAARRRAAAPLDGRGRPPSQSVLLVCGLLVLGAMLSSCGPGSGPTSAASALTWTSLVVAGRLVPRAPRQLGDRDDDRRAGARDRRARRRQLALRPGEQAAYRWLLLALSLACTLASLVLRGDRPRHAELLVITGGPGDAGDLRSLAAAQVLLADRRPDGAPAGLLGARRARRGLRPDRLRRGRPRAGRRLARRREPARVRVVVKRRREATLLGWPLILLALGGGVMAAGLRPRRPLPPEPAGYSVERPLASRADDER